MSKPSPKETPDPASFKKLQMRKCLMQGLAHDRLGVFVFVFVFIWEKKRHKLVEGVVGRGGSRPLAKRGA